MRKPFVGHLNFVTILVENLPKLESLVVTGSLVSLGFKQVINVGVGCRNAGYLETISQTNIGSKCATPCELISISKYPPCLERF